MAKLIIAKDGSSIDDAEKDLVFTSERSCMVEIFSGYLDIVNDVDGIGSVEFTHNLGYKPAYYCFVRDPQNTGNWYPHNDGFIGIKTNVDDTKFYAYSFFGLASTTYRIYYSIFGNQQENGTGTGNNNVTGKLKISKDGYNAETETDARNMKFFSGKNVYKIDDTLSGSASVTIDDPVVFKIIPHNLGYVPIVFVLNDSSYGISGGQMLPSSQTSLSMSFYVNNSDLVLIIQDASGGSPPFNMTFKYKITRDKIA